MRLDSSGAARQGRRVGVLGGTFDPFHRGHEAAAAHAARALDLEEVLLVPSRIPPHRSAAPFASEADRAAMVALAAESHPCWKVDDLELTRTGSSYTYDTLVQIGERGIAPSELFFITGADAFAEIATWSRFPHVLDLAHFVVITRAGRGLASFGKQLPELADRMTTAEGLSHSQTTRIVLVEALTPDVSSTEIRRRVVEGEAITGLVAPPVEAYILRHQLYRSASPEVGR